MASKTRDRTGDQAAIKTWPENQAFDLDGVEFDLSRITTEEWLTHLEITQPGRRSESVTARQIVDQWITFFVQTVKVCPWGAADDPQTFTNLPQFTVWEDLINRVFDAVEDIRKKVKAKPKP